MISFKANYIKPVTINRVLTNTPVKASFVELDSECSDDVRAVKDIADSWDCGETFAKNIWDQFWECSWLGFRNGKRFFALTMQRNNFEKLNPYEVLGLAQITEGNAEQIKINFLQTDPSNKYLSRDREFSGIGKAILDSIRGLFNTNIVLRSVDSAKKFYQKYGFEQIKRSSEFILRNKC